MSNNKTSSSSKIKLGLPMVFVAGTAIAYFTEPEFHEAANATYGIACAATVGLGTSVGSKIGVWAGGILGSVSGAIIGAFASNDYNSEDTMKASCCIGGLVFGVGGFIGGMVAGYNYSSDYLKDWIKDKEDVKIEQKAVSYQNNSIEILSPKIESSHEFNNNQIITMSEQKTLVLNNFTPNTLVA